MRYRITLPIILAAILMLVFGAAGVSHAFMLVSEKMEISIGKDVAAQAEREMGGVSTDEKLNARVESVGKKIVSVSDRKNLPYTFKILNSKDLNAFACPGGPVYITKGLLEKLETDDQLAFVLGHEVGHIARQHGRKAINKGLTAGVISSVLFSGSDQAVQQGVSIAWTLVDRGYSRDQEYEADNCGVVYAMKAGYSGSGAIEALKILQQESGGGKSSGLNKLLATHPPIANRIDRVQKLLDQNKPIQ